ncbi:MAG TPA: zinc ribbon domain-containing protein [Pyrinomonadaceae bacterium]|nr:zinc ribbon domain-containing protein [Pyrinomonadaceae bacterium]
MPIVNCPECGHDVSDSAVACPSCGKPLGIRPVTPARPVVVNERDEGGIPPWAFVAMGVVAVLVLFFIFAMMGRDDDTANSNLRVSVEADRDSPRSSSTDSPSSSVPGYVPDSSASDSSTVPSTDTTVPGSQSSVTSPPDRGVVKIDARIVTREGQPEAVRNEKFYLLEKDLEQILREADLRPIEGNSLSNSFGLAVLYPDRYGDFHRKALDAINKNIEYSGTTDSSGKAELPNVEPGNYYLFGITKTPNGFALWSSPVSVRGGENNLNLAPQRLNEIQRSGE